MEPKDYITITNYGPTDTYYCQGGIKCKSEEVLSKLKERLKNEIENQMELANGKLLNYGYPGAIKDIINLIAELES